MTTTIEDAIRETAGSIENLVRTVVRDELRRHLGPEADHLINVKAGPMSAGKLRALVRSGQLHGYKHGNDTFISASEFRSFIEGRPVPLTKPLVAPEPAVDPTQDGLDDVFVAIRRGPADPEERRAFYARLAQRRAEGGPRGEALRQAELQRDQFEEDARKSAERAAKRAVKKKAKAQT